ncbi:MAG: hypothetical protein IJW77_05635 [Clostridia bacterium]|nr:hypothetical protein [Clostridia bacterium]
MEDERIPAFAAALSDVAHVQILTLDCDDETRTRRILTRDNGNEYRDTEAAAEIAKKIRYTPYEGEQRFDSGCMTVEEILDDILIYHY